MTNPLRLARISPLGTLFALTAFVGVSILYLSLLASRSLPDNLPFPDINKPPSPSPQVAGAKDDDQVLVTRIIDGDTIEIESGQLVRYIGIDTPEISFRSTPDCFAQDAKQANHDLVFGRQVILEKDVSETDRYGRLLRYVWINQTMVNEDLVRRGYALVSSFPPDVRYQDLFLSAQKLAREENLGLWSACR